MSKTVDLFIVYQFLKRLVRPFDEWEAFEKGVIDNKGNILVKPNKRDKKQKDSLTRFDILVMNLKKLLAKVPGGSSRLVSLSAALFLLKEGKENLNASRDELENLIYKYFEEAEKILNEEGPATNTSGVAGLTPDTVGVQTFMGKKVFKVNMDRIMSCRFGKRKYDRYCKYVGMDEIGEEIRQYARKHPKEDIILKDSRTGQMVFLRRK